MEDNKSESETPMDAIEVYIQKALEKVKENDAIISAAKIANTKTESLLHIWE